MRGDDEVPHVECDGEECVAMCKSLLRSELQTSTTPDEILHELQEYCESKQMEEYCTRHGVNGVTFRWNPHLQCRRRSLFRRHRHGRLYQQFWKAYQENPTLNLALAFHGTAESNVPRILHYGLDPQYRRTQAFGNGEYFSKEPGLAATYRHEGHCLLVFLLLMPKDHEKLFSQKDRDIIVVPELSHQLPLGVLNFQDVNEHKIQHSQDMRMEQRHLKQVAMECDWQITQAKLVKEVTVLLKNGQFSLASQALREATKYHKLSPKVQEALACRAEEYLVDPTVRAELFPMLSHAESPEGLLDLPPMSQLEAQAEEAWNAFLAMKMDPNRNLTEEDNDKARLMTCSLQVPTHYRSPGVNLVIENC